MSQEVIEREDYNQLNVRYAGNSGWGLLLTNSDGTANDNYHFSTSGNNNSTAVVNVNKDALHLGTDNKVRMTIDHEGKVGIGTVRPLANFHVKSNAWSIFEGASYNQLNVRHTGNSGWGLLLTNSDGTANDNYHFSTSGNNNSTAVVNVNKDALHLGTDNKVRMTIDHEGKVGIGTLTPDNDASLTVKGNISAREIKVTATAGGADFVFEDDYSLNSLDQVEKFTKENKHLPEIPSAKEMERDGINLAELNIKLLQKVEELTLYLIEQNKEMKAQREEIEVLKIKIGD